MYVPTHLGLDSPVFLPGGQSVMRAEPRPASIKLRWEQAHEVTKVRQINAQTSPGEYSGKGVQKKGGGDREKRLVFDVSVRVTQLGGSAR